MKTFYISKRYGAVIEGTKRDAIFRNGKYWDLNIISILEDDFRRIQNRRKGLAQGKKDTEAKEVER